MIENYKINSFPYQITRYVREAPVSCRDFNSMMRPSEVGIYEFLGIQRTGKSLMMTSFLLNHVLFDYGYTVNEVFANYTIEVDGINCMRSNPMVDRFIKAYDDMETHLVWCIDEASQPPWFYARNTRDKRQTKGALAFWQCPKRRNPVLFSDNIGNSVDIQQRDATWFTIMPIDIIWEHGKPEAVIIRVISNYEMWYSDYIYYGITIARELYDDREPIH